MLAHSVPTPETPRFFHYSVKQLKVKESAAELIAFNVTGDGNCMYYAVILAYLMPALNDYETFQNRFKQFGHISDEAIKLTHNDLKNYDGDQKKLLMLQLENLVNCYFRNALADHMQKNNCIDPAFVENHDLDTFYARMRRHFDWGDNFTLIGLSHMLKIKISTFNFNSETNVLEKNPLIYGEEHTSEIKLLLDNNHYFFLLPPDMLTLTFMACTESQFVNSIKALGNPPQNYIQADETTIRKNFLEFYPTEETKMEDVKNFLIDQYYFLPDYKTPLASSIRNFLQKHFDFYIFAETNFMVTNIKLRHIQFIGQRYLEKYPTPGKGFFGRHNSHKQAQLLRDGIDPHDKTKLEENSHPTKIWIALIRIYATLSDGSLATDIERLITHAFHISIDYMRNEFLVPTCRNFAIALTKKIAPEQQVKNEIAIIKSISLK